MEVFIIRHTRVAVENGICYGQTDVSLADTFIEEAELYAAHLQEVSFDAVYSSPLSRCTALAAYFSPTPFLDERLKEMDFGKWEMQPWNAISSQEIRPWYADFVTTEVPQGESFEKLYQRCAAFVNELKTQNYERVLLVTHSGIIRCLWCYLLEIPLKNAFKIPVQFGETLQMIISNNPDENRLLRWDH